MLFLTVAGCSKEPSTDVIECVRRGVAYFKEIDSYPYLKSEPNAGRHADTVANERCARTTTAF